MNKVHTIICLHDKKLKLTFQYSSVGQKLNKLQLNKLFYNNYWQSCLFTSYCI